MTRPAIMADRYIYLPLFAIIVLFLHLLFNLLIIITPALTFKKLLLLAPVVYVLTLCIYSHELTGEWAKLNLIK